MVPLQHRTRRLAPLTPLALALALAAPAWAQEHGDPPVVAPFEKLDTLCANDWWNREASKIVDVKVERKDVVAFALYTTHAGILRMSAQLYPLYPSESRTVRLEIQGAEGWTEIAEARVNDIGWSALFEVEGWDGSASVPYRVRHGEEAMFQGTIRRDPRDQEEIRIASLSCNSNQDRSPRTQIVQNLLHQDPDLVFFAGDQSYDHKQHTAAWLLFGTQFREVFRDRPCVTIPDDHDVGHGNLWGEGGVVSQRGDASDGGYKFDADYVRMVERCQTAHLPAPYDPTPIEQGIGVYYTSMLLGWLDVAIIEDRKFKTGPHGTIPQMGPRPDHVRDPAYDPASIDLPGLKLLGERQLEFLEAWGKGRPDTMKVVLSQTGFCGGAHIHGRATNRLHADLDSNGWPQSGRKRALRLIQAAGAVHLGGDQHISTVIQHGIDEHRDGPWAFISPAIVNNYYSRWWWPEDEGPGKNPDPAWIQPWTSDYFDGFGNPITMVAYANPGERANGAGYGLVRFRRAEHEVTFERWPSNVDVTQEDADQFTGWPVVVQPGK